MSSKILFSIIPITMLTSGLLFADGINKESVKEVSTNTIVVATNTAPVTVSTNKLAKKSGKLQQQWDKVLEEERVITIGETTNQVVNEALNFGEDTKTLAVDLVEEVKKGVPGKTENEQALNILKRLINTAGGASFSTNNITILDL